MKKAILFISIFLGGLIGTGFAQNKETKEINYTSERTSKNEEKYPGALLMYKVNNQVTFDHEGIKVWCDQAIFYKDDNFFRASGNVKMVQGDSITLTSDYAEYDGNTEFAFASNDVFLQTNTTTLATDSLFFDRQKQQAFYRSGGTVRDTASTITSRVGRYYTDEKMYSFRRDVVVTSDEYVINSEHIDFYTESGHAYLFGPSTITGTNSKLYCERGFYDTHNDKGYFVKNSKVFYENRELEGDSIYFDRNRSFASATNNIKVTDTTNQSVARGHYAEVFRDKDSIFITKRALVSKRQENDSIHIHSDTIMVTGKPENRLIRAFYNAKFFKEDMNGRADSIAMNEKRGLTELLGRPIIFSDLTQMTGDTIELYNHPKTNKLDSLSVYSNAFLVQKDTLGGYNQVKGKIMYGLFKDNKFDEAHFIKNTETIYYWRDDKTGDLIGINKAVASEIKVDFEDNEVSAIQYIESPENITHRPSDFPENARKLRGLLWRGDERILTKTDLFKEDPPFDLPKIKGIPLPTEKGFFDDGDTERKRFNEKSRLTPELLQDRKEDLPHDERLDSLETKDSLKAKPIPKEIKVSE